LSDPVGAALCPTLPWWWCSGRRLVVTPTGGRLRRRALIDHLADQPDKLNVELLPGGLVDVGVVLHHPSLDAPTKRRLGDYDDVTGQF